MKALLCKEHGLPETLVVDEVANPTPGKNKVVLDVKAAALEIMKNQVSCCRSIRNQPSNMGSSI